MSRPKTDSASVHAKGHASIDLTMADSITEWRVSMLANSTDGRLGGAESGVKVFQDFFVDVSFPATLTRGSASFSYHLQALMPVKAVDGGAEAHLYYEPTTRVAVASQAFEVKN